MLNSFWDDKNKKPDKHRRPNRSEIKERKADVRITKSNKEIGRTTVVKKADTKSQYWSETPKTKNGHWVEQKNGKKSAMGLKRENFVTEESDELDIELLKDNIDAQGKKISHLVSLLSTQKEEFENYKKNTQEVLSLITDALKIKVLEQNVKEETILEILDEESDKEILKEEIILDEESDKEILKEEIINKPIHKRSYFEPSPFLKVIELNFLNEIVYPFGNKIVTNYKKDEECSFNLKIGKDECYAYGYFGNDDNGYLTIEIDEFTKENGEKYNMKNVRFPLILNYIEDSSSSESSNSSDEEVDEVVVEEVEEQVVEEEEQEVGEIEEVVVEEVGEDVEEVGEVVDEVDEEVEELEEVVVQEVVEKVEEVEEVLDEVEKHVEEVEEHVEKHVEEVEEHVEEVEEHVEEVEQVEVDEQEVDEQEVDEQEVDVEVVEEQVVKTEMVKLIIQPIPKSETDTSESKESPILELPRLKLPPFQIPQFKKNK